MTRAQLEHLIRAAATIADDSDGRDGACGGNWYEILPALDPNSQLQIAVIVSMLFTTLCRLSWADLGSRVDP